VRNIDSLELLSIIGMMTLLRSITLH